MNAGSLSSSSFEASATNDDAQHQCLTFVVPIIFQEKEQQ